MCVNGLKLSIKKPRNFRGFQKHHEKTLVQIADILITR